LRGLGRLSRIANKQLDAARSVHARVAPIPPVIHSLGMDLVPVDELSNQAFGKRHKSPVEPVPKPGLAVIRLFSTRLFDCP
jgi:hypothetical protein